MREIVEYSETNTERYGYYRLVNDITYTYSAAYGANITNASGIYGFKGVLDGKDGDGFGFVVERYFRNDRRRRGH